MNDPLDLLARAQRLAEEVRSDSLREAVATDEAATPDAEPQAAAEREVESAGSSRKGSGKCK